MKKSEIVKKTTDFDNIIKNGKKYANDYFIIYYNDNNEYISKFGVAVSKKLGNAVFRNKYKRILRSLIDENKLLFKKNYNYIIMITRNGAKQSYQILNNSIKQLIEKVK